MNSQAFSKDMSEACLDHCHHSYNPKSKEILLEKLWKMKELHKVYHSEIIRETSEIITYIEEASNCALKKLKKNESKLDRMINSLMCISNPKPSPKLSRFLQMEPTELLEAHDFEYPILSISSSKLKSMIKGIFHVNSLFKKHVFTPKSFQIPIFRNFTKDLAIINLDTKNTINYSLDSPQPLSKSTCMCILPGRNYFCYGNYADYSYSGLSLLIDPQLNAKKLSDGVPCHCSGGTYLRGCVYVFGGYNHKGLLSLAEKYTISTDSWSKLSQLPEPSDYCSCIAFGEKIILSGNMHSKLYSYDPLLNSYDELFSLTPARSKVLCGANSRLFIIESSGRIYESAIKDLRVWEHLWEASVVRFSPLSCAVTHDESIFFALSNNQVYRFDIAKKSIEEYSEI